MRREEEVVNYGNNGENKRKKEDNDDRNNFTNLIEINNNNRKIKKAKKRKQNIVDEIVPLEKLFPSQIRFSRVLVEKKKLRIQKTNSLPNDLPSNSSLNSTKIDSLPVVKSCFGYVLVDSHHELIAHKELGSKEFPIRIVEDFSLLEESSFWKKMEEKNYSHLLDWEGLKVDPPLFKDLKDDPNRFLAHLICRKYSKKEIQKIKKGKDLLSFGKGSEYPIWLKFNKDIPFIEFRISDVIWKGGIVYDEQKYGVDIPEELMEKLRQLISCSDIPNIKVLSEKIHFSNIDLRKYI